MVLEILDTEERNMIYAILTNLRVFIQKSLTFTWSEKQAVAAAFKKGSSLFKVKFTRMRKDLPVLVWTDIGSSLVANSKSGSTFYRPNSPYALNLTL